MSKEKNKWKEIRTLAKNSKRSFLILWEKQRAIVIFLIGTMLLGAASGYLYNGAIALLVDSVAAPNTAILGVKAALIVLLAIWLLNDLTDRIRTHVDQRYYIRLEQDLELMFLKKREDLDMARFEDPEFNDLLQRGMERSIHPIRDLFDLQLYNIRNITSVIIASVIMFSYHWIVFVLVLLAAVPLFVVEMGHAKRAYGIYAAKAPVRRRFFDIKHHFTDKHSMNDMRFLGIARKFYKTVESLFKDFTTEQIKNERKRIFHQVIAGLISFIAVGSALVFIVLRTIDGQNEIGSLVFVISSIASLSTTFEHFLMNVARQREQNLFTTDLFAILDTKPLYPRENATFSLDLKKPPVIEFQNVWFKYPFGSKEWVLEDLSVTIDSREKLALVGVNGAGKSTFVKLLMGIYPPTKGKILINGIDLETIKLDSWWQHVAILTQDFVTYHFTVRESIALGRDGGEELLFDKVRDAAEGAEAHSFIEKWKDTYNQMIGVEFENGIDPSHGQKQKIAIARSLYRNPFVLIMDEPTSAVDAEAEAKIFERLEKILKDKSLILVSHRFSTVRNADTISVLKDHVITESGTHEDLLKNKGVYADLFAKQAKGYK